MDVEGNWQIPVPVAVVTSNRLLGSWHYESPPNTTAGNLHLSLPYDKKSVSRITSPICMLCHPKVPVICLVRVEVSGTQTVLVL